VGLSRRTGPDILSGINRIDMSSFRGSRSPAKTAFRGIGQQLRRHDPENDIGLGWLTLLRLLHYCSEEESTAASTSVLSYVGHTSTQS